MLIARNVLIMVLDGARMSLFQNKGSMREPRLELLAEEKRKTPSTAELGDERPGRIFQSSGNTRGAYETSDLHQQAEEEFAVEMAELLIFNMGDDGQQAILVAEPKVLGAMRKHLSPNIRARLLAEIAKDYCGQNAADLGKLLDDYQHTS